MIYTLQTSRLILRPFSAEDADQVNVLAGDLKISEMTMHIPHPYSEEVARRWISTHTQSFLSDKARIFAITRKTDGTLIGAITLTRTGGGGVAELGYWIGVPFWNKGYCTEAVRAVLKHGFDQWQLKVVSGYYFLENPASGRVMEKAGMVKKGVLTKHFHKGERFYDAGIMSILSSEYDESLGSKMS